MIEMNLLYIKLFYHSYLLACVLQFTVIFTLPLQLIKGHVSNGREIVAKWEARAQVQVGPDKLRSKTICIPLGSPPISFLWVHCQICFFPALPSLILFFTFLVLFSCVFFPLQSPSAQHGSPFPSLSSSYL